MPKITEPKGRIYFWQIELEMPNSYTVIQQSSGMSMYTRAAIVILLIVMILFTSVSGNPLSPIIPPESEGEQRETDLFIIRVALLLLCLAIVVFIFPLIFPSRATAPVIIKRV